MTARTFFKRFKWGTLVPSFLLAAAAIVVLAASYDGFRKACGIPLGVIFLVAGVLAAASFLCGLDDNVGWMLCGVAMVAVSIWLFAVRPVSVGVFAIATAIIAGFRAVAEGFGAYFLKREGSRVFWIVRIVLGALYLALAVTAAVDPFDTDPALKTFAGVTLLLCAVFTFASSLVGGPFEKEEELRFRPVKKGKGGEN